MDDVLTFDEEGQVNIDDDNVEQILEQLVDNTVITLPRSTALKQRPDEPKVAIDIAINSQMDDIKDVIHRYIVTEQNLLFERRCKDWMIIQFVRSLDQFIANFNSHVFFRKMPLLCNMDEQFGKVGEEKTEKQEQFSKLHRFHSQSQLLRSAGDKQLNFNSEQMNAMAIDHLRHHDQILQPLIEMLIYSGQVHGPMRQVPSNELRALFEESGIGEKEQQELLVKIVGGVRTAAPTYIINMISKFCHETKWIQRDLEFIRQQRERTLSALPSLAKLKRLLLEYRKNPQADAFECPLCMESLCEAEAVALFPCGHMCCYACHSSCNSTVHKPRIDDVAIGVATVGSQCFLCRYLLQFNEKISKVTFSEAVSIVLSTTETTPVQPVIEAPQIDPTQTPTTDRRLAIGPDTTATMLHEEFFDYNTSESEGDVILDDINSDDHLEEDFAFADLFDDSSDSGTVPQQSKPQLEPEFLKTGPATDCLIDLFKQYEASCDYSERQIVISYGMMQTMRNIMRRVVKRLMTDGECPNVFVKFVSFPISSEDRLDVLSDAVYNAEFSGKIPVVIYMFHMDLNFSLARDQCLQQLLYINKVNAILMIETPAVRLVDDRASHLLTASIEQRFLSFFCNEFSLIRPTVHRFIIASESMMTVDKSWHDQTRWYAVKNEKK